MIDKDVSLIFEHFEKREALNFDSNSFKNYLNFKIINSIKKLNDKFQLKKFIYLHKKNKT